MSSAGTIYRDYIEDISASAVGSQTFTFDIENDGVLISARRTSGDARLQLRLFSELPGNTGSALLGTIILEDNNIAQGAFVTSRKIRVELDYDTEMTASLHVKMLSGDGVRAWQEQQAQYVATLPGYLNGRARRIEAETLMLLGQIQDSNERILNHMRELTDIETDKGDEY